MSARRPALLSEPFKFEVDPEAEREARDTLRTCASLEEMYASDGWAWFTNECRKAELASTQVVEATGRDLDVIYAHRERLKLIRWMLALPDITARSRAEASQTLDPQEEP